MPPESRNPESASLPRSSDVDLLEEQREANEKLVVATFLAREEADTARGAQASAEQTAGELRVSEEELLAVAEFRERLLGIVGHDLRNPLNTVLMAGGLLIARGALSDGDGRLVHRIVSSGQRMSRMIDQLLAFTRARLGGGFQLVLAQADLGQVCGNIAEELRISSATDVHVELLGQLSGTWDADRLAEVISNIASNAIDHATPGTPVLIFAHAEGDDAVAEITNQGICIPADVLPVIFKAFRRAGADSAASSGAHMGLGLYISCEIVRSHGGTLDVRSSDGSTTFTVRLPRVPPPPVSRRFAA